MVICGIHKKLFKIRKKRRRAIRFRVCQRCSKRCVWRGRRHICSNCAQKQRVGPNSRSSKFGFTYVFSLPCVRSFGRGKRADRRKRTKNCGGYCAVWTCRRVRRHCVDEKVFYKNAQKYFCSVCAFGRDKIFVLICFKKEKK